MNKNENNKFDNLSISVTNFPVVSARLAGEQIFPDNNVRFRSIFPILSTCFLYPYKNISIDKAPTTVLFHNIIFSVVHTDSALGRALLHPLQLWYREFTVA